MNEVNCFEIYISWLHSASGFKNHDIRNMYLCISFLELFGRTSLLNIIVRVFNKTHMYLLSFVETPRKFIIAELSIRKLGSSSVL